MGYADDDDRQGHEHDTLLPGYPTVERGLMLSEIASGSDRLSHRGSMMPRAAAAMH
jgi:hypothetical protein